MAHRDAREGKWRGNRQMEWVASNLRTTSEHGVSSITTADAHTSAASSRLNWLPCRFKWTRSFHRKTKSSFCACAITFQMQSTTHRCRQLLSPPVRYKRLGRATNRALAIKTLSFQSKIALPWVANKQRRNNHEHKRRTATTALAYTLLTHRNL
jgi:hypothetical protein